MHSTYREADRDWNDSAVLPIVNPLVLVPSFRRLITPVDTRQRQLRIEPIGVSGWPQFLEAQINELRPLHQGETGSRRMRALRNWCGAVFLKLPVRSRVHGR